MRSPSKKLHSISIIVVKKTNDRILKRIERKLKKMDETQEQLVGEVVAATEQIARVGTETSTLIEKVAALEAAMATAGQVTPEVQAAMQALKKQVQTVDDLVPDVTPAPQPEPIPVPPPVE